MQQRQHKQKRSHDEARCQEAKNPALFVYNSDVNALSYLTARPTWVTQPLLREVLRDISQSYANHDSQPEENGETLTVDHHSPII